MLGVRSKTRAPVATLVCGDALATVEYLDHPGGGTDIDLLADEAVWDGIEEALELDVIIRRDPCQAPFGELVVLAGQACERRTFHRFEEMPAADTEPSHDMIVDAREHLGDRGIGGMMTKRPEMPMAYWGFYFIVPGIDSAIEKVKSLGGEILMGPHEVPGGSWIAACQDPQGAYYNLTSATR